MSAVALESTMMKLSVRYNMSPFFASSPSQGSHFSPSRVFPVFIACVFVVGSVAAAVVAAVAAALARYVGRVSACFIEVLGPGERVRVVITRAVYVRGLSGSSASTTSLLFSSIASVCRWFRARRWYASADCVLLAREGGVLLRFCSSRRSLYPMSDRSECVAASGWAVGRLGQDLRDGLGKGAGHLLDSVVSVRASIIVICVFFINGTCS
jgi:hypothetical protein